MSPFCRFWRGPALFLALLQAFLLGGCALRPAPGSESAQAERKAREAAATLAALKGPEVREEHKRFIAHDFFLRARQQELEGNEAVALSFYQIAFEWDKESRDLCFILTERLKDAGRLDSALRLGLSCLNLEGEPTSREEQMIAEVYLRRGELEQALVFYHKALKLDENDRDVLYTLATLYESLKDVENQATILDKLLPRIDYPLRLVEKQAENYRALKKPEAEKALLLSAWKRSGNAAFGERLAAFHELKGDYAGLLQVMGGLLEEDPKNPQYRLQKARSFLLLDAADSALVLYAGLAAESPDKEEYLFPYASLLFERGRFAEARDLFQSLARKFPQKAPYRFFLASALLETGEGDKAEREMRKAIELDGKVPDYFARLAYLHLRRGREEKALELLREMKTLFPKPEQAHHLLGTAYQSHAAFLEEKGGERAGEKSGAKTNRRTAALVRREREKAVAQFREALALDSADTRLWFEVGVGLERLGRIPEATEALKRAVALDSSEAMALNYLGYLLVEADLEMDRAIRLIDRALQLDPDNGAYLDSKAWWFYKKGDMRRAREFIEMAVKKMPRDSTVLEHYARILEKLGEKESAEKQWRLIQNLGDEPAR